MGGFFTLSKDHDRPTNGRVDFRLESGFTLVELVAVFGVLALLVGTLLPSLGTTIQHSRTVRDGAQLQQNAVLLGVYANDHRSLFPVSRPNAFAAARYWYEAFETGGYVGAVREIDPAAFARFGVITFELSLCVVYDPNRMFPGRTVSHGQADSRGVRTDQVTYPSLKGVLYKGSDRMSTEGQLWCCNRRWTVPVAMGDGSIVFGDYISFSHNQPIIVIDSIGLPVYSTWGGYLARDR